MSSGCPHSNRYLESDKVRNRKGVWTHWHRKGLSEQNPGNTGTNIFRSILPKAKVTQMSRIPKTIITRDPHSCQSFFMLGHWISGFLGVLGILHQNTSLFRASELCVTGLKESSRVGKGRLRLPYLIPPQVPRIRSPENSAVLNADQTVMTVLLSGLGVYTRP